MNKNLEQRPMNDLVLNQSKEILDLFVNIQAVNNDKIVNNLLPANFPAREELRNNEMCFFKVKQLAFDEEYPRREAFENVLMSMDNAAYNLVYILTGSETGVELCLGVVKNENTNEAVLGKKLSASDYGEIVAKAFTSNFVGSELEVLRGANLTNTIISSVSKYRNAGVIMGVPSINEKEDVDGYDFQGIDRLINNMLGLNWRLVIVCEPVPDAEVLALREDVYELYNRLAVSSKHNLQIAENDAKTISFSKNTSETRGKNSGWNEGDSDSRGESHGSDDSWNKNHTHSYGKSGGTNESNTKGKTASYSQNRGSSKSVTVEIANKKAQELMKYIDEELLERTKLGFSKGMFKTSVYYMAEEPTHANRLKAGIISLFQGNKSGFSPLVAQNIDLQDGYKILKTYQNRYIENGNFASDSLILLSRPFYGSNVGLGTYLTTREVSLLAGLPQKEVPGLTLREAVEFGLNEKNINVAEDINLGCLVQKGRELNKLPFYVKRDTLRKHTFIAGTTGSGKTTTCHRLLMESKNVPFLVLEPAKTEYRTLIKSNVFKDLIVFTLGNETVAPFRINPFELVKGEIISAHIDMLKATFTSAFPMEASMPQLLEEAIYRCYENKGWNIDTNENDIYGDKAFNPEIDSFPILSELLTIMKDVVEEKGFSTQMKSDYIGSLVSRLSNLTVGSKGAMLNCAHSIDFKYLAHHNVVLEMEELKSPEDKALVMGFVLSRLAAVIKEEHKLNVDYEHLTLVEEAHRLLAKVDYSDPGSKKVAVETFTDLLAEVRKYGEGLIIVDQIPNKLASEVLKNTNTKIIHKILARDDKEAVGDTMLMDDKQKEYLSALKVGDAIVFTENTDKPVNIHVAQASDTSEKEIRNEVVKSRFLEYKLRFGLVYEFMEIQPYYSKFAALVKNLATANVQVEEIEKIKQIVKNIAQRNNESEKVVWGKFIRRREAVEGKEIVQFDNKDKRFVALLKLFSETLYKKDFSRSDILAFGKQGLRL